MTNLIIVLSNCHVCQPNGRFIRMTAIFLAAATLIFSESPPALQPFIMLPPIFIRETPARHLNVTLFHRTDQARDYRNRGLDLSCEAAWPQSRIIRPSQKAQDERRHSQSICQHISEPPALLNPRRSHQRAKGFSVL